MSWKKYWQNCAEHVWWWHRQTVKILLIGFKVSYSVYVKFSKFYSANEFKEFSKLVG